MRRFEYKDQKSDKFWEIEQTGPELTTRWGRIGTGGQSKTKDFGNELSAKMAMTKQIDEKLGKGYQEVAASGQSLKPASPPSSAETVTNQAPPADQPPETLPPTEEPAAPSVPKPAPSSADAAAPWLRGRPSYILPTKSFPGSYYKEFVTLPSRRNPVKSELTEAALPLAECFNQFKQEHSFYAEKSASPLQEAVREAASFVDNYHEGLAISENAAAIIVSALIADWSYSSSDAHLYKIKSNILVHLRDKLGLPDFIGTFCAAESLQVNTVHLYPGRGLIFSDIVGASNHGSYGGFLSGGEQTVRALLAQAEEEQWLACEKIILENIDSLDPMRQPRVALVIPDSRDISDHAARHLLALPQIPYTIKALIFTATDPQLTEAVEKAEPDFPSYFYQNEAGYLVDEQLGNTLLAERGEKALDLLLPKAEVPHIGYLLAHINDPRAIETLALLIQKGGKKSIANTQLAVKNWPKAALVALGGLLIKSRRETSFLLPTFITLCQDHPQELAEISAWFDETTRKAVQELLNSGANVARADLDGLPEVLVNPPWTQKRVRKELKIIKLEPLSLEPVLDWDEQDKKRGLAVMSSQNTRQDVELKKASANVKYALQQIGLGPDRNHNQNIPQEILIRIADSAAKNNAEEMVAAIEDFFKQVDELRKTSRWSWYHYLNCVFLIHMPEKLGAAIFNNFITKYDGSYYVETMAAKFGLAVAPGVIALVKRSPGEYAEVAGHYGMTEMAPIMARAFHKLKSVKEAGRDWLLKFPEHAVRALIAPALGNRGEARDCAAAALRFLNGKGYHDLIMETAALYQNSEVPEALEEVLNESELDIFPAKIPSKPSWWQPNAWRTPIVADGPEKGKALPSAAVDHIGTMLAFPADEGWYAGLEEVKALCAKDSLAMFAWDMFSTWQGSGAPSKEKWGFLALGLFGNDNTARKLTPYIREWPGQAAHARAVMGLDVLAEIGSDVALMQLNGIAQKVKFKGLQDKAREKIQQIADNLGLTTEELEDRLAPDFGLNEQGSLTLDFGPRQFVVGFDEALRPFVKDQSGKRLTNLPKPGRTDDQALAGEASETFKGLKKDVKTVAAQQIFRLEQAMCGRRHWNLEHFETFLVQHPLIRHLTQRLVWAFYLMEPDSKGLISNYGGIPAGFFRVSEDGSYTDAADNPLELPASDNLRLGIPHIMEMPPEVQAEFGQLFADYELIQPFPQLGREIFSLRDDEKDGATLSRWSENEITVGHVFGLGHRGWRRGTPQDGGWVGWMYKNLGQGIYALADLDEGFGIGWTEMSEPQKIAGIQIGPMKEQWEHIENPMILKDVDPIIISELIRQMEILTKGNL